MGAAGRPGGRRPVRTGRQRHPRAPALTVAEAGGVTTSRVGYATNQVRGQGGIHTHTVSREKRGDCARAA